MKEEIGMRSEEIGIMLHHCPQDYLSDNFFNFLTTIKLSKCET